MNFQPEIFRLTPMPPRRRAQMLSSLRILGRNNSVSTERCPGKKKFHIKILILSCKLSLAKRHTRPDRLMHPQCLRTNNNGGSGHLAKVAKVLSFRDHPWRYTSYTFQYTFIICRIELQHPCTCCLYSYLASWLWFISSCITAFDVGASHLAHHWLKWPPDHHTSLRSRTSPRNSGGFSSPWMTFIVLSSYFKALHHLEWLVFDVSLYITALCEYLVVNLSFTSCMFSEVMTLALQWHSLAHCLCDSFGFRFKMYILKNSTQQKINHKFCSL